VDDARPLRRLDALGRVALRLALTARSGRIALARAADAIELDWVPRPWGEELLEAFAEARAATGEPLPPRQVERVLRSAWGAAPGRELDDLELEQPVAVTPGAQVHRGSLDGRPVAVKVLRPGLAAVVRQDLALLETLAAPLRAAFPALDAAAVLREVRQRVLEELDLEHEAEVQRRFHRGLRGHPFLSVPAPLTRLCHEDVLVSEWVEGVPLDRAPDPDRAAAQLVVFVVGAARLGIVPADVKPSDVLVRRDGGVSVVDFGASAEVDRARAEATAQAVQALIDRDAAALGAALERLGVLPAELGATALQAAHEVLGELLAPQATQLDGAAVIAVRDRLIERPELVLELLNVAAPAPSDLWPARGIAAMFATVARAAGGAGARADWPGLVLRALREGWNVPL
jgi:predicted unusual protein kinase regulating ubiquinone biosynthesis (AarF/ABC1/UbiB family)